MAATQLSIRHVCLDVCLLSVLGIVLLMMVLFARPYQRGFTCNDPTIRFVSIKICGRFKNPYPFRLPYKEGTISEGVCATIGISVVFTTIIVLEIYRVIFREKRPEYVEYRQKRYKIRNKNVHRIFVRLWYFLGHYLLGAAANQLVTEIGKVTVGRLRPHFLDVCRPEVIFRGIVGGTDPIFHCGDNPGRYIYNFKCTEPRDGSLPEFLSRLEDARMSFPSGHSSFGFYSMLFVVLYIHARCHFVLGSYLVHVAFQFCCICLAILNAVFRISDHKHHWTDVLAGTILGLFMGIVMTQYVAKFFTLRNQELPKEIQEGEAAETNNGRPLHRETDYYYQADEQNMRQQQEEDENRGATPMAHITPINVTSTNV